MVTFIIVCCIGYFITKESKKRNDLLENNSFKTYAVIEKLKERASKSTTTTKDVIYFYFIHNNVAYHKISSKPNNFISNNNIEINDVFELEVVNDDFNIFEVNFKKRKDTTIVKKKVSKEIYNSNKHIKLINNEKQ